MKHSGTLKVPLLIAGAFVVGGGTAVLMSHRLPPPPSQNGRADKDAAPPDADAKSGAAGASADGAPPDVVTLTPTARRNAGIKVEVVRDTPTHTSLAVPGTIRASTNGVATVTPPVAGRVTGLLVNLGDQVRAGQPLATLNSLDVAQAQAAVRQAQSEVRQAGARVQTAQTQVEQARDRERGVEITLRRQDALARAGAFSQSPVQAAQSEQSQAQSELLQAQAELDNKAATVRRDQALLTDGLVAQKELDLAQTELRQSQIRVDQGQARVALARKTLVREQSVFRQNLLSQQATQTAQAEVRAAQGEVRRAQTDVQAARTAVVGARDAEAAARANLEAILGRGQAGGAGQIRLLAPISGTVTQRVVTLGEAVERSSILLVIENLTTVTAQANVGEQDVALVRVGQPVTVTVASYPDQRFAGVVQGLGSDLDPKTRTLPVRCLVENQSGRLRPEMFAQIAIVTDAARPVVTLPSAAIIADGDQRFVYVAQGDGYRKRTVKASGASGGRVEVRSGLRDGERVVTNGAFVLDSEAKKGALGDKD